MKQKALLAALWAQMAGAIGLVAFAFVMALTPVSPHIYSGHAVWLANAEAQQVGNGRYLYPLTAFGTITNAAVSSNTLLLPIGKSATAPAGGALLRQLWCNYAATTSPFAPVGSAINLAVGLYDGTNYNVLGVVTVAASTGTQTNGQVNLLNQLSTGVLASAAPLTGAATIDTDGNGNKSIELGAGVSFFFQVQSAVSSSNRVFCVGLGDQATQ